MNENIIKKYIEDNQLIMGLYKSFQKEYKKLNNFNKHLYKENLKRTLNEITCLRFEVFSIIKEFVFIFGKLSNLCSFEKIYRHFYYQLFTNKEQFINIIIDSLVANDELEKVFYHIVDSTTQKIILAHWFYQEYKENMNQDLDKLKLPNNLKYWKINYKNLKKKQLPTLQQLCNDEIKKQTNIICFPYLELDKKLQNINFKINIEKINAINFNQFLTNTNKTILTTI